MIMDMSKPIVVGIHNYELGTCFSYSKVKFDKDGWADSSQFLPIPYDICYCKMKDKVIPGWYNGHSWDGRKIKENDKILYWKLNYDN